LGVEVAPERQCESRRNSKRVSQPNKLEEWRDALTGGEDREVTFTLLLTKRCGFACAHCMFAAGPGANAEWMPAGVLDEVLLAARTFRDWGFRTRLNLLGGEPTLDLERFALIHSHISHHPLSHDLEMEMTTNGWWLRSWKDTCRFAGIVGEAVAREELAIRISNSTWHDPYRKGEKHLINRRALQEALENPCEWFDLPEPLCQCGGALVYEEGGRRCGACGESMSEEEYYEAKDASMMQPGHYAVPLLIEGIKSGNVGIDAKWTEPNRLSPAGRALKNGMGLQGGACHPASELKFTVNPDGTIRDVCCHGGRAPMGRIRDGALHLFALRYELLKAVHEQFPQAEERLHSNGAKRCRGCPGFASQWLRREKPKLEPLLREFGLVRRPTFEEVA
jgi:hypothetical protein